MRRTRRGVSWSPLLPPEPTADPSGERGFLHHKYFFPLDLLYLFARSMAAGSKYVISGGSDDKCTIYEMSGRTEHGTLVHHDVSLDLSKLMDWICLTYLPLLSWHGMPSHDMPCILWRENMPVHAFGARLINSWIPSSRPATPFVSILGCFKI